MNWYVYADNNPTSLIDPSGLYNTNEHQYRYCDYDNGTFNWFSNWYYGSNYWNNFDFGDSGYSGTDSSTHFDFSKQFYYTGFDPLSGYTSNIQTYSLYAHPYEVQKSMMNYPHLWSEERYARGQQQQEYYSNLYQIGQLSTRTLENLTRETPEISDENYMQNYYAEYERYKLALLTYPEVYKNEDLLISALNIDPTNAGSWNDFNTEFSKAYGNDYEQAIGRQVFGEMARDFLLYKTADIVLGRANSYLNKLVAERFAQRPFDFTNVKNFSDLKSRIPSNAQEIPWRKINGGASSGIKFQWKDLSGNVWQVRAHSIDPSAPIGSNASKNWIYRVQVQPGGIGRPLFMDSNGTFHKMNVFNPRSPYYDPTISNDTHIMFDDFIY